MEHRIDVCVPTMNRVDLLLTLAESIPRAWKVHVSDNGGYLLKSGRGAERAWDISSSDEVIGLYPNWRKATTMGQAPWFFLPSDDDLYYASAEAAVLKALESDPDVGMVIFGHHVIDEQGNVLQTWIPPLSGVVSSEEAFGLFKTGVHARMPSVLFNRRIFAEAGGISDRYVLTAGDSEVIQRLCIRNKVLFVPEVISAYRVWNGSFTHQKIASKLWSDEIEIWMGMLDQELRATSWGRPWFFRRSIQDEIRMLNIQQGVARLASLRERIAFLRLKPYPFLASLRTQKRLLKLILKGARGH